MRHEKPSCTPILDGSDSDFMYFRVRSFSRPALMHELVICKRTGVVRCLCEDSSYRKKEADLLDLLAHDPETNPCKHMRELVRVYGSLFKP